MLDNNETQLKDAVDEFVDALWSDEPMPEPEGTRVSERVMFDMPSRANRMQHQRSRGADSNNAAVNTRSHPLPAKLRWRETVV